MNSRDTDVKQKAWIRMKSIQNIEEERVRNGE